MLRIKNGTIEDLKRRGLKDIREIDVKAERRRIAEARRLEGWRLRHPCRAF